MSEFPASAFIEVAKSSFGFEMTENQQHALQVFTDYIQEEDPSVFVLTGFAGTGKSSLVAHLIKTLKLYRIHSRLLAPTGRAAKVFSGFAGAQALTIHKQIYFSGNEVDGSKPTLGFNRYKNTLFFVDECSMISGFDFNEGTNVLEDLITFVRNGQNCKLVFIGDNGQLPPVGQDESPVFSMDFWQEHFPFLKIYHASLKQVVRTGASSAILENATFIRSLDDYDEPLFPYIDGKEVFRVSGLEVQEFLEQAYSESGQDETVVLTMSNKRANKWNQEIRNRLLYREELLERGDFMMVVKNNYFWLDPQSSAGFIANGEFFRITRVDKVEQQYGFDFAHLRIRFLNTEDDNEHKVIVLLEAILSDSANLPRSRMKELFFEIEKDYAHERNKKKRYASILKNPYFNALQVKYANAVTVHKAQGGQWENVFVDYGFVPDEMKNFGYLRWLYTAVTRATKRLYLINFPEELFTT